MFSLFGFLRRAKDPVLHEHRNEKSQAAILFIHGFSGNIEETWGRFPHILSEDPRLKQWDIFSLGYDTNLRLDVPGIWSASPPLDRLAYLLRTAVKYSPLDRYKNIALVAHSMGGLILQKALVDDEDLCQRVGHVIFFGTPSNGLLKAGLFRFWKRQLRDMQQGRPFIISLRQRWTECFDRNPPFLFLSVAGERDEFVPSSSSLEPFPDARRRVVPGNHLEIVKPRDAKSYSVQLVIDMLVGGAASVGPWNAARVAVELRDFQKAINEMLPHQAQLDDAARVVLALALDSVDRREDAIAVLRSGGATDTDAMGTLAGRLKRRWLAERRKEDAEEALELYQRGLALAKSAPENHSQAFYHAINVAFMELAYHGKRNSAQKFALEALEHCSAVEEVDIWKLATEGEAYLLLGQEEEAVQRYQQALELEPSPWQIASMYQQAIRVASLLKGRQVAKRLEELFRGEDR